jgi:hypothetical protein
LNKTLESNGKVRLVDYNPELIGKNAYRIYMSMYGDTNDQYFSYEKINPETALVKNDKGDYVLAPDVEIDLVMNVNGATNYMLSFSDFLYKTVSINNVQLAITINDDSLDMLDSPYSKY